MRSLIMLAGAAAIAASMPALADAQGRGKGHSMRAAQGASVDVRGRGNVRIRGADRNANGIPDFRERRLADINGNGIPDFRERRLVDLNGNGIADFRERFIDRNLDRIDDRAQNRWGGAVCPPGLEKRIPPCIPPGQVNREFRLGQRLPLTYRFFTDFDAIPLAVRNEFGIPVGYRYIYRPNDVVYVVDPTTRMIRDIIDLIG